MISILAKGAPEEWKEREWEWDGQGGRKVMKGGNSAMEVNTIIG